MGSLYDPELIKFARFILLGAGELTKKYELSVQLRPSRIIRSVLGHLVATKNSEHPSTFDDQVRDYLFNSQKLLPENIHVYVWTYPYDATVIVRDIAIGWIGHDVTFCHVLKFYPVGFLITQDTQIPLTIKIPKLKDAKLDHYESIPLPPVIRDFGWPEMPADNRFTMGGQTLTDGTFAIPKQRIN
jgi:hypothetical protein